MKAFHEVLRNKLWDKMRSKGYAEHLIRTIEGMYEDTTMCIDTGRSVSSRSEITNQGIRLGCHISSTLLYI
jgi:hypothetical protein